MKIGYNINDFRNLTTKIWANFDNPIKSYDLFKVLINFLYATFSGGTLPSVMSQQYNYMYLMELYTKFVTQFPFS